MPSQVLHPQFEHFDEVREQSLWKNKSFMPSARTFSRPGVSCWGPTTHQGENIIGCTKPNVPHSQRRPTFQILSDFGRMFVIIAFDLLIEQFVALIDVICIVVFVGLALETGLFLLLNASVQLIGQSSCPIPFLLRIDLLFQWIESGSTVNLRR